MAPPLDAFTRLASKWGPWTALALVLVGLLVMRFDAKVDAQGLRLERLQQSQINTVKLLRIMCVAAVKTEAERTACREVGDDR
ncbi:MAG TPA: hypothetical protein VGR82_17625 [Methylomirabilota bacterium]|jgi:hypothetical protein|nr:hypothetical protein [Methylomirabilota bacterium]